MDLVPILSSSSTLFKRVIDDGNLSAASVGAKHDKNFSFLQYFKHILLVINVLATKRSAVPKGSSARHVIHV